jgi:hypothetical protein
MPARRAEEIQGHGGPQTEKTKFATRGQANRRAARPASTAADDEAAIHPDQVWVEDVREAGPVHVGHPVATA